MPELSLIHLLSADLQNISDGFRSLADHLSAFDQHASQPNDSDQIDSDQFSSQPDGFPPAEEPPWETDAHTGREETPVPKSAPERPRDLTCQIPDPRRDALLARLWKQMIDDDLADPLLIRTVVAERGYYPMETAIRDYQPAFIEDVLLAAWPQVRELAEEKKNALPF